MAAILLWFPKPVEPPRQGLIHAGRFPPAYVVSADGRLLYRQCVIAGLQPADTSHRGQKGVSGDRQISRD